MTSTYFLATVIGWYLVIVSVFFITKRQSAVDMLRDIMESSGLYYTMGVITLIIGLLMVTSHNLWVMGWPVVITIISWIVLLVSLYRIFCQDSVYKVWLSLTEKSGYLMSLCLILLGIGLFLLYKVYVA